MRKTMYLFMALILASLAVIGYTWTPPGEISGQGVRSIFNMSTINATQFYSDGTLLNTAGAANCSGDVDCDNIVYASNTTFVQNHQDRSFVNITNVGGIMENTTIIRYTNGTWVSDMMINGSIIRVTNTTWVTDNQIKSYINVTDEGINMTGTLRNITDVECFKFITGGKMCGGS